jgi:hypothetical protein
MWSSLLPHTSMKMMAAVVPRLEETMLSRTALNVWAVVKEVHTGGKNASKTPAKVRILITSVHAQDGVF